MSENMKVVKTISGIGINYRGNIYYRILFSIDTVTWLHADYTQVESKEFIDNILEAEYDKLYN